MATQPALMPIEQYLRTRYSPMWTSSTRGN